MVDEDEMLLEYLRPLSCGRLFPELPSVGTLLLISVRTNAPETVDTHLYADFRVSVLNRGHLVGHCVVLHVCEGQVGDPPHGMPLAEE